jgi:hypothetical protein
LRFVENKKEQPTIFVSLHKSILIQIIVKRVTTTTSTIMKFTTQAVPSLFTTERSMAMPPVHLTPFSLHDTFSGGPNSNHAVSGKKDRYLAILQAALDILDMIEDEDEPAAQLSGSTRNCGQPQ